MANFVIAKHFNNMYTAIKGIYDNGKIIFSEDVPTSDAYEVLVTFLKKKSSKGIGGTKRKAGSLLKMGEKLNKKFAIPDDFNAPLDDLKEYL